MNKTNQWKIVCFLALQSFLFTFGAAQNPQESAAAKKELKESIISIIPRIINMESRIRFPNLKIRKRIIKIRKEGIITL
jgi:hypothetical protein